MEDFIGYGFLTYFWIYRSLSIIVIGLAIVGLIQAFGTRDDAFMVIDRKKQNWLIALGAAAVCGLMGIMPSPFPLWIIGAVIVGIYWQDVRPSIRDVLGNQGGSW